MNTEVVERTDLANVSEPQYELIQGDSLRALTTIPDESVQCVVTSPPYYGLRDYGVEGQIGREASPQSYIDKLVEVFREVRRTLKSDGTLWVNIADTYAANRTYQVASTKGGAKHSPAQGNSGASKVPDGMKSKDLIGIPWMLAFALRADGWYLRQDIIWHKPNVMPESVKDRCTKCHEYVFLLTKSEKYSFDSDAIKEPVTESTKSRLAQNVADRVGSTRGNGGNKTNGNIKAVGNGVSRNKRSVWTIPTKGFKDAHFAVFPEALVEPCILAGCPEGGTVLDPFSGAATTGVVALKHNRKYIGIELNPEYIELSHRRLQGTQVVQ